MSQTPFTAKPKPFKQSRLIRQNLGPMGEFDDVTIFRMEPNLQRYLEVVGLQGGRLALDMERKITSIIIRPLTATLTASIKRLVPKDTGRLQERMLLSITPQGGSIHGFVTWIALNTTGIPYAKPVNKMPSAWLKHPGAHPLMRARQIRRGVKPMLAIRTHSRFTGVRLRDPSAETDWWRKVRRGGRTRARFVFSRFIDWVASQISGAVLVELQRRRRRRSTARNVAQSMFRHSIPGVP